MRKQSNTRGVLDQSQPRIHQRAHETQPFNAVIKLPIALDIEVCRNSVELLNQLLADTMTLRDLYKKHHLTGSAEALPFSLPEERLPWRPADDRSRGPRRPFT